MGVRADGYSCLRLRGERMAYTAEEVATLLDSSFQGPDSSGRGRGREGQGERAGGAGGEGEAGRGLAALQLLQPVERTVVNHIDIIILTLHTCIYMYYYI